jgi:hypothetical protein
MYPDFLFACPTVDCEGNLHSVIQRENFRGHGNLQTMEQELKTVCKFCQKGYCKECKQPWHAGKVCDTEVLDWDLMGAA